MSGLVLTRRGKNLVQALVSLLVLAACLVFLLTAFHAGEARRCTYLAEHGPTLALTTECPASYLP